MPLNRSGSRDVFFYNAEDRNTQLGGLILNKGITNRNFYSMITILCVLKSSPVLRDEHDIVVEQNNDQLKPGNYYLAGFSLMNTEAWLVRTISPSVTSRPLSFCNEVRQRDRRCVVTGRVVQSAHLDRWIGFQASHIFPLAHEDHWLQHDFGRWISIPPVAGGTINSIQNGMLLDNTAHALFAAYDFSINPDDNHKIISFSYDDMNISGTHLDARFLADPRRPSDHLLRWHFRQAVLANMRGAGEPIFEQDFPPGSDMMSDIVRGPKPEERMEFELFSRLPSTHSPDQNTLLPR